MITYHIPKIEVLLEGRIVGTIRPDFLTTQEVALRGKEHAGDIGWRYFPGSVLVGQRKRAGEWFADLEDCKHSLEG